MKKSGLAMSALSVLALVAIVGAPARSAQLAGNLPVAAPPATAQNLDSNSSLPQEDSKIHPGPALEAASAATARELPGVTLQVELLKTSFMVGEPIELTLIYRNDGDKPIHFTRTSTGFRPMSVVRREFRARQLDGDALLESESSKYGVISEFVGGEDIKPHQDVHETVFLNERFFFSRPGRYELTAWSSAVAAQGTGSLYGKSRWLQSAPTVLQILPATEAFKALVLGEAQQQIDAAVGFTQGRAENNHPPDLDRLRQVAQRLVWLQDKRAIPLLLSAFEAGSSIQYAFEYALKKYPRAQVMAALKTHPDDLASITIGLAEWLNQGDNSPEERTALLAQIDKNWRSYLQVSPTPQHRGTTALLALKNSSTLRQDAQFWHEALINLGSGEQNQGFELFNLLSGGFNERKTRVDEYPIQTADLKVALEARVPLPVRMFFIHALEVRDPAYLRQFLLARVDDLDFEYPRGAFEVFDDEQLKDVVSALLASITSPAWEHDPGWRDTFGRRLRDIALRGATLAQLEQTEAWLLQNAPEADAPILDAIQLKIPARTWFWLQQSLAKRPLASPYDSRMRVLVLQQNNAARQMVRALLQEGSDNRRTEVLNAIYNALAEPVIPEVRARWFSDDEVSPRATALTFANLKAELARLATSDAVTAEVKRTAKQVYGMLVAP